VVEWFDGLETVRADAKAGKIDARALRDVALRHFAAEKMAGRIADAFYALCGCKKP
jgi:hypothetical protein